MMLWLNVWNDVINVGKRLYLVVFFIDIKEYFICKGSGLWNLNVILLRWMFVNFKILGYIEVGRSVFNVGNCI